MAYHPDVTTVRNVSGVTMYFSFLGERGATLTNGQDVDVPGDLFTMWAKDPVMRGALKYALENNKIEVLRTPTPPIFYDATSTIYRNLKVNNGSVSVQDLEYGSYSGTAPST